MPDKSCPQGESRRRKSKNVILIQIAYQPLSLIYSTEISCVDHTHNYAHTFLTISWQKKVSRRAARRFQPIERSSLL
ncbi:hypothetical protein Plhal703r1_c39g0137201 [Plasmopara halstedii]